MASFRERWFSKSPAFEKPGNTTHSEKWDRCVEHVARGGNADNAYAVCTAAIGDETTKSMDSVSFLEKVDEYIERLNISSGMANKAVDTGYAGEVPNSLLAGQDLEGKRREGQENHVNWKSQGIDKSSTIYVCWKDKRGGYQERAFGNPRDAMAYADDLEFVEGYDVKVRMGKSEKAAVDEAQKKLDEVAEDTDGSKKTIAERIKAAQIKVQRTTIAARAGEATGKSFVEEWAKTREGKG